MLNPEGASGVLFDGVPFTLCGGPSDDPCLVKLWARESNGPVAFEATASLRSG